MVNKLTSQTQAEVTGSYLVSPNRREVPFRLLIDHIFENGYQFKNMKTEDVKVFSNFLKETIGKKLTISEVENLFLRTKGPSYTEENINGKKRKVYHFGKDRTTFRIFGYFDLDDYFCVHRIDPKHKHNKG